MNESVRFISFNFVIFVKVPISISLNFLSFSGICCIMYLFEVEFGFFGGQGVKISGRGGGILLFAQCFQVQMAKEI